MTSLGLRDLRAGDRYLLCSDGLSPVVDDGTLRNVLTSAANPACAVRQLAALAEDGGGPDNVTVVVIDVQAAQAGLAPAGPVTFGAAATVAAVR